MSWMCDYFQINKKKIVYQWELDLIKDWDTNTIRNNIWMATQCNQPIPGCVSVEALRVSLVQRGEEPVGYHENIEDVSMRNIEIEQKFTNRRKGR